MSFEMPSSGEIERAVLGCLLIRPDYAPTIKIGPSAFYVKRNALIFSAMMDEHEASGMLDIQTVSQRLKTQGRLQDAGGLAYLSGLDAALPDSDRRRFDDYCFKLHKYEEQRKALRAAERLIDAAARGSSQDVDREVSRTGAVFSGIGLGVGSFQPVSLSGDAKKLEEMVSRVSDQWGAYERKEIDKPPVFSHGLPGSAVDTIPDFFEREVVMVAARSGVGKTSLCMQVSESFDRQGGTTAYISCEMVGHILAARAVSRASGVPMRSILHGKMDEPQWGRFLEECGKLASSDSGIFVIPTSAAKTIEELMSMALSVKPDLVVVDFFQHMPFLTGERERGAQAEKNLAYYLQNRCAASGVNLLLASQIRKHDGGGEPPAPTMWDVRGTGALADISDRIIAIHRRYAPVSNKGYEPTNEAYLMCLKDRVDRLATVNCLFKGFRFTPAASHF